MTAGSGEALRQQLETAALEMDVDSLLAIVAAVRVATATEIAEAIEAECVPECECYPCEARHYDAGVALATVRARRAGGSVPAPKGDQ